MTYRNCLRAAGLRELCCKSLDCEENEAQVEGPSLAGTPTEVRQGALAIPSHGPGLKRDF